MPYASFLLAAAVAAASCDSVVCTSQARTRAAPASPPAPPPPEPHAARESLDCPLSIGISADLGSRAARPRLHGLARAVPLAAQPKR